MLETTARHNNRHILVVVTAGIAQIATKKNGGAIEKVAPLFLRSFQLGK